MTIGKKIFLAFTALFLMSTILATISLLNVSRIDTAVHSIAVDSLPGISSSARLDSLVREMRVVMLRHIALDNIDLKYQAESEIADAQGKFQTEQRNYEKTIYTARDRELFEKIAPAYDRFVTAWARIEPISREMKIKEAMTAWMSEGFPAAAAASNAIGEEVEFNHAAGEANSAAAMMTADSARLWSMLILAITAVFGSLLGLFVVRGINHSLTQAVTELSEGAEQVATASSQVASSSQSLAQGASEQAASLQETSASSEEIAAMTRKNAENAQHAAEFMGAMSRRVSEANGALDEMMTSMREIGASSGKISKIIKVIDEIAFQTNILALNAAVEAARAGEAGMGFAVVADEVRNLAQRSAQAAKDTAALIEESILKSGEGGRKLGEVAGSIQAITQEADKVKTLIDEVDASSKEQAQGIEQISGTVAGMDQVTQRTAASAEQSASASEELNAQSRALIAVIARLEAMVGSERNRIESRRPIGNRTWATRPPSSDRGASQSAHGIPLCPTSEFPLDDSEFKEF